MKNNISKSIIITIVLSLLAVIFSFAYANTTQAATLTASVSSKMYTECTAKVKVKLGSKSVSASKCKFSSSSKSIATVNSSGIVTAKKAGKVKITVKYKTKKVVKTITVVKNPLTVPFKTYNFVKGYSGKLPIYYKGKRVYGETITVKTSNKNIATIATNGDLKAKATGKVTITYTLKSDTKCKKVLTINVVNPSYTFTVSPSSAPLNATGVNFSSYNSYTKHYYLLRSYFEYFEKSGGGSLALKAGTYNLPSAVYIPSNVLLKLYDGAVLKKTMTTNTSGLKATPTMIMFCEPSKVQKSGAYSGYGGVHDSSIVGYGSATIDMASAVDSSKSAISIVMCHNNNINITGVTFTNNNKNGHYIELDASSNVTVSNCTFKNQNQSNSTSVKECINLDTPDKKTGGFSHDWSSYDCTPNKNVTITNNKFSNVQVGIGTHMYSANKYHSNIQITNNKFYSCRLYGIRALNWKDSNIKGNTFNGIGYNTSGAKLDSSVDQYAKTRVLYLAGCDAVDIINNNFSNFSYAVQFKPFTSVYSETNNNRDYYTDDKLTEIANSNYYCSSTTTKKADCAELRYFASDNTSSTTFKCAFATK